MVAPAATGVKSYFREWGPEGGRVELQRLMSPLTGLTGRVQYPLATPSKTTVCQAKS